MVPNLRTLVRRIASLRHPRLHTLEEWIEHHRQRVQRDIAEILRYIPEDATILDVGANVGLFTEAVLAHRPRAKAILFEPVERYYRLCVERLGDRPNVRIHHVGLSQANESLPIYMTPHNYGGNSVVKELMFDSRENTLVPPGTVLGEGVIHCRRFDELSLELGIHEADFIKTDTEGFEYSVLRGMLPFLQRVPRLPVILSELLMESFHPYGVEQRAVVEDIVGLGYHPLDMEGMTERVADFLFVPLDREPA